MVTIQLLLISNNLCKSSSHRCQERVLTIRLRKASKTSTCAQNSKQVFVWQSRKEKEKLGKQAGRMKDIKREKLSDGKRKRFLNSMIAAVNSSHALFQGKSWEMWERHNKARSASGSSRKQSKFLPSTDSQIMEKNGALLKIWKEFKTI